MILIQATAIFVVLLPAFADHHQKAPCYRRPAASLFNCSNIADGSYPDPKRACSQIYYQCTNGTALQYICRPNTFYDVVSNSCKPRENVVACSGAPPAPTVAAIVTTEQPTESTVTSTTVEVTTEEIICPNTQTESPTPETSTDEGAAPPSPAGLPINTASPSTESTTETSTSAVETTVEQSTSTPSTQLVEETPTAAATTETTTESTTEETSTPVIEATEETTTVAEETVETTTEQATEVVPPETPAVLEQSTTEQATEVVPPETPAVLEQSTTELTTEEVPPETPAVLEQSTTEQATELPPETPAVPEETTVEPETSTESVTEIVETPAAIDVQTTPPAETVTEEETTVTNPTESALDVTTPIDIVTPTKPPCEKSDSGFYPDPTSSLKWQFCTCVGQNDALPQLACGKSKIFNPPAGARKRRHIPPVESLFNCTNKGDGSYPDPEQNCSRVFYKCAAGKLSQVDCPRNTFFDVDTKACKSREAVAACASESPATTGAPAVEGQGQQQQQQGATPALLPTVTEKVPIDCSKLETGQYPDPANKCSKIYYVCFNGLGVKLSCPGGTYYDPKSKGCDYFDNVFVCSGKQKPATTIAPKPKPSPASVLSIEFNCKQKKDGSYLPPSKKCSEHYFKCAGGATVKVTCPRGLYYNIAKDRCVTWANIFDCAGSNPTTRKPRTTTKGRTPAKLPIDCSKKPDGDYPDPEKKCSSVYYTCSNTVGIRRNCPQITFFDQTVRICDARENVVDCGGKPRPPTTPVGKRPTPASLQGAFDCQKRADGNYPSGKCAPDYWSCVAGQTVKASCAPDTVYDHDQDECSFKQYVPACGGSRQTTPSKAS